MKTAMTEDNIKSRVRYLLFAVLVSVFASCATPRHDTESATPAGGGELVSTYLIGVDDGLQISVWRNPELSVSVPVRPDGKISVPLIGDVQAGGLTPEEVGSIIKQKLSSYIRDPSVTVIVTTLRSSEFLNRVRITGAVRNARSFPFRPGMTVLDAVLEAGGVNDFAAPNRTKLYRKSAAGVQVINVELGDILNKGKLETNLLMRPGDVITVPERIF